MMMERVNFVMTTEVPLPEELMADKIADIMFAAFGLVFPSARPEAGPAAKAICGQPSRGDGRRGEMR